MKFRSSRRKRQFSETLSTKDDHASINSVSDRPGATNRRYHDEVGIMTETSLKLFVGLFISLVASISLVRLIPYHFAQSLKLKELKSQVKETEYRVKSKKLQLMKNFDSQQAENLREQYSSRIEKHKIRLFWRDRDKSE